MKRTLTLLLALLASASLLLMPGFIMAAIHRGLGSWEPGPDQCVEKVMKIVRSCADAAGIEDTSFVRLF